MISINHKIFDKILDKLKELDYTGYSEQYPPFGSWNKLEPSQAKIKKAWEKTLLDNSDMGLFVNIPFCRRKCVFCFLPVVCVGNNQETIDGFFEDYFKTLEKEAGAYSGIFKNRAFETLYIGGGTPSLMNPPQINKFFQLLNLKFNLKKTRQIILEIHPQDINREKVEAFKKHKVSRVCLGVQSMDEKVLTKIKRRQNFNEIKKAYAVLLKADIKEVNIDLICGLPGQNETSFLSDLKIISKLKPDQIHINSFISTPYTIHSIQGGEKPNYEKIEKTRKKAFRFLNALGYIKIDSDSMGRTHKSKNIQTTDLCLKKSILGLGPGAISRAWSAFRYINIVSWKNYKTSLNKGFLPAERGIQTTLKDEMIYFAIEKLSNTGELRFKDFKKLFNEDFEDVFPNESQKLKFYGAAFSKDKIKTPLGFWNSIRQTFYTSKVMIGGLKNLKLKPSFLKKF